MSMETIILPEKYSIKNLLFTRAIPNHVIPVPTDGYKVYSCIDCGDRFMFQSSYDYHINRKSVKINYMCRYCSNSKEFYNRCNLLHHIRSHAFKTATINVTDLNVEPLPLGHYNKYMVKVKNKTTCPECKADITGTGSSCKDRAIHFMKHIKEQPHTCPLCLFSIPTECALKAHMRIHLKRPPYYCPECGGQIPNRFSCPYNHDCEGFRILRATSRMKCPIESCPAFHPSEQKEHMKKKHTKKVFKCPLCVVACFNEFTMRSHLKNHKSEAKPLIFYQCEICPGRLVLQNQIESHLRKHPIISAYPCWKCATTFNSANSLIEHFLTKHDEISSSMKHWLPHLINNTQSNTSNPKCASVYKVVKKCDQCQTSFTYKCKFDEISSLPNECPKKCSPNSMYQIIPTENNELHREQRMYDSTDIVCDLCKERISQNWDEIKKHYAKNHKTIKCLDIELIIPKLDINKFLNPKEKEKSKPARSTLNNTIRKGKKRRQSTKKLVTPTKSISASGGEEFVCNICQEKCDDKQLLEKHMVSHRDPCMAYQCLECGQSFVVKPSFSTHLLLAHQITDSDAYIANKDCYNKNALTVSQQVDSVPEEPLRENQCQICRAQYENAEDLQKHFRVHGMAFLLKSTSKSTESTRA